MGIPYQIEKMLIADSCWYVFSGMDIAEAKSARLAKFERENASEWVDWMMDQRILEFFETLENDEVLDSQHTESIHAPDVAYERMWEKYWELVNNL